MSARPRSAPLLCATLEGILRTWPGRLVAAIAMLILATAGAALGAVGGPDSGGYFYTDSEGGAVPYDYESIAGTGTVAGVSSNTDDGFDLVPIGFDFNYYGVTYSELRVTSNGFLCFSSNLGIDNYISQPIPSATAPNGIIAGWWQDLGPHEAGTIYYQTLGNAPNRRFIVQYSGVQARNDPTTVFDFVIKLFEADDSIEIHYSQVNPDGFQATVGIESPFGDTGLQYFRGIGVPPLGFNPFAVRFTPYAVTNTADDADTVGSLRYALDFTPTGGRIGFGPTLDGATIPLDGVQLGLDRNVIIDASSLPRGVTISGQDASRVIHVGPGVTASLKNLIITGGNTTGQGGGIYNEGNLELTDCAVVGNRTTFFGGGICNATSSSATLTFTNGSICNNRAVTAGGGITTIGGAVGNEAFGIELTNVTISGNHVSANGANQAFGGGLHLQLSYATLTNVTIAGNTTAVAALGGGIFRQSGDLHVENSVIAGNFAVRVPDDVRAAVTTRAGVNFIGNPAGSSGFGTVGTDYLTGDPMLTRLAYFGGPLLAMHPLAGSPLIDPTGTTNPGGSDQRGYARLVGTSVDIGAVEAGPVTLVKDAGDSAAVAGTLRNAVTNAVPGSVIRFDPTIFGPGGTTTIASSSAEALGSGASVFIDASNISGGITLDSEGQNRLLRQDDPSSTIAIHNLRLINGNVGNLDGGGIFAVGWLSVLHSEVSGCSARQGAGIYLTIGRAIVADSLISGNAAASSNSGGGISNLGDMTLIDSTLSGNTAGPFGGGIFNSAAMEIVRCTLTGNSSTARGGAIFNQAGMQVINSTISGNHSNATGGGITALGGDLTLTESIVAGNTATTANPDLDDFALGTVAATGVNLLGSLEGSGLSASPSLLVGDPLLSPLGNYGGPTPTMAPLPGSPAIDVGTTALQLWPSDQRGQPRVADGDGDTVALPDLGAFEVGRVLVTSSADSGPGSLREALSTNLGHLGVEFDTGVFDGSPDAAIVLASEIDVPGGIFLLDAQDIPGGVTLDGNGTNRILRLRPGAVMEMDTFTLTRGFTPSGQSGGAVYNEGTLTLRNSTLARNRSGQFGGAVENRPGATLELFNSTLANNLAASDGGAICNFSNTSTLTLVSCTLSANVSGATGGAIWSQTGAPVSIGNTLISGNRALFSTQDFRGSVASDLGNNLIGDGTGISAGLSNGVNANQIGTGGVPIDARLAPLGHYGGPTETMALLAASPAINAGNTGSLVPAVDQRGRARVGATDIGALEAEAVTYVTNTNDSGAGSLRDAIALAAGNSSRILFNLPSSDSHITLTSGELTIAGSASVLIDASRLVDGAGIPRLEPDSFRPTEMVEVSGVTIDGGGNSRVLVRQAGNPATLHSTTITGGQLGSGNGGGILNLGLLNLIRCTVSGNSITGRGAGISTLFDASDLYLIESTVSGNDSSDLGGGIEVFGRASIISSTVSGNSSPSGGGIYTFSPSVVTIEHSTIAGNTSTSAGGGIRHGGASMHLSHTIVAANNAPSSPDIFLGGGTLTRGGPNLIGDNTSVSTVFPAGQPNANGDQVGTAAARLDPGLDVLGDYGGPTETHALLPNSPAEDAAVADGYLPFTDQRGFARLLSTGLDIGAYETAAVDFNAAGLTLFASIPPAIAAAGPLRFEISSDAGFFATVGTFAGSGSFGTLNGNALAARFSYPSDVARDSAGYYYVADSGNNLIRRISPTGVVSTIAGGAFGLVNGDGDDARFAFPSGIAVGPDDNLYVSDTINHVIRKLTRPEAEGLPWAVSTLAGSGVAGYQDGIGASTMFSHPHALAVGADGSVFVADTLNHCVRKITSAGVVSTYAGTGAAGSDDGDRLVASFSQPFGLALDSGGNLFVADSGNHRIRRIRPDSATATDTQVTTIAGAGEGFLDGSGTAALFSAPTGLSVDSAGNVFVADKDNHAIRKLAKPINAADPWETTTVAGTGGAGFSNGRANFTGAQFNTPTGLQVAPNGDIIVADELNHRLRRVANPLLIDATLVGATPNGTVYNLVLDTASLGLQPETEYFFRWVAADGSHQMSGQSFSIVPVPTVVTTGATGVTRTAATINGTVDPHGSTTTVVFEYSTDPALEGPLRVDTRATGFATPRGMAVDGSGNVFVADRDGHKILRIDTFGMVTNFAGTGVPGFLDGPGAQARFDQPVDLAIDLAGNLYVADELNHRIRKVTPAGQVSTFAGSGVAGYLDAATATDGRFLFPCGVAVDASGSTVYVADRGNHRIRTITGGALETLAGDGTAGFANGPATTAQFNQPSAVAIDPFGNVLVADRDNHRIRLVNAGQVLTAAGSGTPGFLDGPAATAEFSSPSGLAVDAAGRLFIADRDNHRIRVLDPGGQVGTVAGSGIAQVLDSPSASFLYPPTATGFDEPQRVAVDPTSGAVFVTEAGSATVRRIERAPLLTVTLPQTYSGTGETAVGIGIPEGLLPGATYYFRITGSNVQGPAVGEILSFTTLAYQQITIIDGTDPQGEGLAAGLVGLFDFGTTPLGTPIEHSFTIVNTGEWELGISAINAPTGFSVTGGIGSVAPGDSIGFVVMLDATAGGHFSGEVEVLSDDPDFGTFAIPVAGIVLAPPSVTTVDATDVAETTATLNATVNPEDSETTVWFEYSTDPDLAGVLVSTFAGSSTGYAEGTGTAALFSFPLGVATDSSGNLYLADTGNHRIRMLTPDGVSSTIAGTGVAGFADGPAGTAQFNQPVGIVRADDGTLFVSDSNNHRIRAISPAGEVTTFCGLGTSGFTDGVAAAARFNQPWGLARDAAGNLYLADRGNHRIRRIAPDGTASTVAGEGSPGFVDGAGAIAQFDNPRGIAVDGAGRAFVTEFGRHRVRRILPDGTVSTFAGAGTPGHLDATGTAARFSSPAGIAVDALGNLFVTETGNQDIRRITALQVVTTVAGTGAAGADDGPGDLATFNLPVAVAVGASGELTVSEGTNGTLRRVVSSSIIVQAASGLSGVADTPVDTPVAGLLPGFTYYFRAFATNGGGTTYGEILSISGSPFALWQLAEFGPDASDPLIAGPLADPSGDGIVNLLKYAHFLNPLVNSQDGLPVIGLTAGSITLTYTKVIAATDLIYTVECSTDLDNWTSLGLTEQVLSDDGTVQRILASFQRAGEPRKFVRLRVTLLQP